MKLAHVVARFERKSDLKVVTAKTHAEKMLQKARLRLRKARTRKQKSKARKAIAFWRSRIANQRKRRIKERIKDMEREESKSTPSFSEPSSAGGLQIHDLF